MRIRIFCCFAVLSQLISFPLYAAEPVWVKDSTKGCLILNPYPQPNETAAWSGSCVGGKAEGTGEIVWYMDGIPRQTWKLAGENGVTMVAGKETSNVSPNDARFELISCDQGISGYRAIRAFVKKDFALWHQETVAIPVLNMAADFAQARCPTKKGFDNITVGVYYEGDQPQASSMQTGSVKENYQFRARSSNGKWGELDNRALRNWDQPQKQNYATLLARRQADTQMRERTTREAREREQVENAHRIVRERYNAFIKKNSVSQFIDTNALEANPFIYEGKIIAVEMRFSEMLTVDRAIFEGILVSGVPGNLFTAKDTKVVLAGKVLGKTPIKTPFGGEMNVPHLRFVGVHICVNYACSDLVQ